MDSTGGLGSRAMYPYVIDLDMKNAVECMFNHFYPIDISEGYGNLVIISEMLVASPQNNHCINHITSNNRSNDVTH